MGSLRKLAPVSYILALLCFLLPFVQISCGGQKLASLTGVQLMTGTEIKPPTELFGMKANSGDLKVTSSGQKTDPNWFAAMAFIAGVAGVILAVVKTGRAGLVGGIAGAGGAVSLLVMRVNISGEMGKTPMGAAFVIDYQIGYYLALFLFIFGAVGLLGTAFRPAAEAASAGGQSLAAWSPTGGASPGVCSKCGGPLKAGTRFCGACGTWSHSAAN